MKIYDSYKDTGLEWVKNVPEDWECLKIKRVYELITEKSIPNKNDIKIDTTLSIEKLKSPKKIIFFNPKIETAPSVGIDNKKDILAESVLLKFKNLAAVIVIPDLLTPGIKEST